MLSGEFHGFKEPVTLCDVSDVRLLLVGRSPSVAATLDSLMPHPSCVSLRMSEAESHHSLHMHMQHLIDRPALHHSPSHQELDGADADALQLPHVDTEQRVIDWVLALDADPTLPVDDRAFDSSYSTEAGQSLPAPPTVTSSHDGMGTEDKIADDLQSSMPIGSSAKTVMAIERTRLRSDALASATSAPVPMTSLKDDVNSMSSGASAKEEVSRL